MKKIGYLFLLFFFCVFLLLTQQLPEKVALKTSGAGHALDAWAMERMYPSGKIAAQNFYQAFEAKQNSAAQRNDLPNWSAIGPKNIAGRTLALAFHPTDKDIVYLGSAGGGLWKTTSGGKGATAWEIVPTGFPVLGVPAIAINPDNPAEMYIGTGEMYNTDETGPGIVNRLTRGTYGIGILKTVDGGKTWLKSLDWTYQNFTGIQDIVFHPKNRNIIYAATSEGLLKSEDSGNTWNTIHDLPMAVDIAINSENPSIIYVSHGSLFHQDFSGVYRSLDGGFSFERLKGGLPNQYTGKAMICLDPINPDIIYASVADGFRSKGLYKSENRGNNWILLNNEDVARWQGWYSHDVAINPFNTEQLVYVGIDAWWSSQGGRAIIAKGTIDGWPRGEKIIAGMPEGPPNFVHSDIHRAYYHPFVENLVFLATDGGVFVSESGGQSYESRNGGLQTTQFYANFSNSTTDSIFAMGGMQDNSSAIYDGTESWIRVLGGDGMSAAISPINDAFVFGSSQFGWLYRSKDRGKNFLQIKDGSGSGTFSTPLEMAPSAPNVLYLANSTIERSSDFGENWTRRAKVLLDRGNAILTLTVSPRDKDFLVFATVPTRSERGNVFISRNGGASPERIRDLPNRIAKDFTFHPSNSKIIYAVFSGYGTAHLYKTSNSGGTWDVVENNLPDIPHHSLLIDPEFPDHLYIGNDLGVYFSEDGGEHFEIMMDGLPEAVYAMNLSYSPANRKIRLATHGNGVYEAPMVYSLPPFVPSEESDFSITIAPNPVQNSATFSFILPIESQVTLELFDAKGALIGIMIQEEMRNGRNKINSDLSQLAAGVYFYRMKVKNTRDSKSKIFSKRLVKY